MSRFFKISNTAGESAVIDDSNISTETTYSSYEINAKIGDLSNLDTKLSEALNTDNKTIDCVNALNKVFQYGNNVKSDTVTALIAKGANDVTVNSPWSDIIQSIKDLVISGAPGTLKQITKLNITATSTSPAIKDILLDSAVDDKLQLATSVLLFIPGSTGVVEHVCGFDNSDSSNFNYNSKYIMFDGKMRSINRDTKTWNDLGKIENYEQYECEVDESLYKSLDSFLDSGDTLVLGVIYPEQLITAKSDMNLTNVDKLKLISISSLGFRFALSFDGGINYYSWNGSSWITVDITNLEDVKAKFMDKATLDSLTDTQFEALRNGSNILRLAYLPEQITSTDPCYTDQLDITVDMKGKDIIAPQDNWDYKLLDDKQTLEYNFYVSGTYTINYI